MPYGNTPLVEPFGAPEIFVDDWDEFYSEDGILTCAGFRYHRETGERVVVVRIAMRASRFHRAMEKAVASIEAEESLMQLRRRTLVMS